MQKFCSFKEFYKEFQNKEVVLINDHCFKYVMKDKEIAALVLQTIGFDVKPDNIIIDSEVGVGVVNVDCKGEMRVDLQITDFISQATYELEAQNYNEDMRFKGFLKLIKKINSNVDSNHNISKLNDIQSYYLIVFDNYDKPTSSVSEEILILRKENNKYETYYPGKIILYYLKNINKNDKIPSEDKTNTKEEERIKRLKKLLGSFTKSGRELQKDGDLLMTKIGNRIEEFNSDEERRRAAFEYEWKQINDRRLQHENDGLAKEIEGLSKTVNKLTNENEDLKSLNQKKDTAIEELSAENQKKDTLLSEKDSMLSVKNNVIATLVNSLKSLGKTNEEIATITGLSVEEVKNM